MRVELRYTEGCPAAQPLRETTEAILEDLAPQEHITFTRVPAGEGTAAAIFPGSPMLQVDGREIGPVATGQVDGTGSLSGLAVPQESEIRAALGRATVNSPFRLPLRHRRLVLIAALLILFGALLSQLVIGGAVVTLTGLALLAVGFSSNGRRKGPQPYMWAAGFTALVWLLVMTVIWSEVVFRAPILLGATEGTLFWVGLASALGAVVSVAAGTAARHRLRRQLRQKLDQP
ncbi:hypothetical protein P4U43_17025 [Arthrobacter sp. EH-1B-1]|uniref:Uncharacterized protein n=1 Tax=Arthrobacter vasquezii TaxID=2977629 RepID=A0ABT6D1T3_9MICC|nr:hypothetical protein [Arthrobacter vasquezii]MDF9279492.1 hypothetical protein [Arthrobacter vasquezii]